MQIQVDPSVVVGDPNAVSLTWGSARFAAGAPSVPVLALVADGRRLLLIFDSVDEALRFSGMAAFQAITCQVENNEGGMRAASPLQGPDGRPLT